MRAGGSFARDWQLIKLARTWQPHDLAGAILERLVEHRNPLVMVEIGKAARALGAEEGRQFRERMPAGMDAVSVLESLFLMGGIWCEAVRGDAGALLRIKKETGTFLAGGAQQRAVAIPFLSGVIEAVAPGAQVREAGDLLEVRVQDEAR
ncbi:MAG TPA: hypothetical protein ENN85_00150 [Methanoculleus sp.]|nr:hypothetical protein [Methanoculleus sp.]